MHMQPPASPLRNDARVADRLRASQQVEIASTSMKSCAPVYLRAAGKQYVHRLLCIVDVRGDVHDGDRGPPQHHGSGEGSRFLQTRLLRKRVEARPEKGIRRAMHERPKGLEQDMPELMYRGTIGRCMSEEDISQLGTSIRASLKP
jgi:hypothetical protein